MTSEQLGKFVKGFTKGLPKVIDQYLYQQPTGLLAAFPTSTIPTQTLELFTRTWAGGELDQALDGAPDDSKWKYVRSYKDMTNSWDKQGFMIFDSATTMAAANRLATDGQRDTVNYFTACRVFKMLRELKAGNTSGNTHAAGTAGGGSASVWGAAGTGDAEADIAKAITTIVGSTGIDVERTTFGVAYPSEVLDEFMQLDLINQVTQRLKDYLKTAWNVNLYAVTPWKDGEGNAYISNRPVTSSDALGTSAMVFVEGPQTMTGGEYRPNDVMLSETERVYGTGYRTLVKQCVEYLVAPTDASANGDSSLIYEITGVTT
jgi:hypothetical protein